MSTPTRQYMKDKQDYTKCSQSKLGHGVDQQPVLQERNTTGVGGVRRRLVGYTRALHQIMLLKGRHTEVLSCLV